MIDMNKKYTYKGMPGRVLAVDVNNDEHPVIWVKNVNGGICIFTADGRLHPSGPICLIEVKPTRWVNIYRHIHPTEHHTKKDADNRAWEKTNRIACIEFTEGEGLSHEED